MPDAADPNAGLSEFSSLMTKALAAGDTDEILAHVKPVNLPDGWREMVLPVFADMKSRELVSEVKPRAEYTNEELHWPEPTPGAFSDVEQILHVSYDAGAETGDYTFPLVHEDGEWKIVIGQ